MQHKLDSHSPTETAHMRDRVCLQDNRFKGILFYGSMWYHTLVSWITKVHVGDTKQWILWLGYFPSLKLLYCMFEHMYLSLPWSVQILWYFEFLWIFFCLNVICNRMIKCKVSQSWCNTLEIKLLVHTKLLVSSILFKHIFNFLMLQKSLM